MDLLSDLATCLCPESDISMQYACDGKELTPRDDVYKSIQKSRTQDNYLKDKDTLYTETSCSKHIVASDDNTCTKARTDTRAGTSSHANMNIDTQIKNILKTRTTTETQTTNMDTDKTTEMKTQTNTNIDTQMKKDI